MLLARDKPLASPFTAGCRPRPLRSSLPQLTATLVSLRRALPSLCETNPPTTKSYLAAIRVKGPPQSKQGGVERQHVEVPFSEALLPASAKEEPISRRRFSASNLLWTMMPIGGSTGLQNCCLLRLPTAGGSTCVKHSSLASPEQHNVVSFGYSQQRHSEVERAFCKLDLP